MNTKVTLEAEIIDLPKELGGKYGLRILQAEKDKLVNEWIVYLKEEDFKVV